MKKIYYLLAGSSLVTPSIIFAQQSGGTLTSFVGTIGGIVSSLIPIGFALAVAAFFFGIAKFVFQTGSGQDEGKKIMTSGALAIIIMVSIFGIAQFFQSTLGITDTDANVPTINLENLSGGS